jgi:hypothetical protein
MKPEKVRYDSLPMLATADGKMLVMWRSGFVVETSIESGTPEAIGKALMELDGYVAQQGENPAVLILSHVDIETYKEHVRRVAESKKPTANPTEDQEDAQ